MGEQLAAGAEALRMFFTDDIYLINGDDTVSNVAAATLPAEGAVPEEIVLKEVPVQVKETVFPLKAPADPVKEIAVPVKEIAVPVIFKYLGKNQKNVLILVNDGQNETSTERGRELLRNIVKALQLTANDFALLNYAAYENSDFSSLTTFFSSKLVLSFGVNPVQLGLDDKPANVIVKEGNIQLVFSQNLDALADNLNEKKALWGSLKQIQL